MKLLASQTYKHGGSIDTYGECTTAKIRIQSPYYEINSQILSHIGFGDRYYDHTNGHTTGETFYTNAININHIRTMYIHP